MTVTSGAPIDSRTRRAVVTGGAGFVGSHLCERLLHDGWAVVCVDSFLTGSASNIAHLQGVERFELIEQDICLGLRIPRRIDAVFHLASPASPRDYSRLRIETLRAGSVGTLAALDFARSAGCRFVYASSSEVYGDAQVHPQREDYWGHVNPVGPRAVYDETKRFGETACLTFGASYAIDVGIVRLFNTYGPRMSIGDGRMVPEFIARALSENADHCIRQRRSDPRAVLDRRYRRWLGQNVGCELLRSSQPGKPV